MPTDTRRLPVPEDSRPYCSAHPQIIPLDSKGLRADGRTPGTVRPVFARVGAICRARGSAYLEMDKTKVICAVYGPREVARRDEFSLRGQLSCEFCFATFSGRIRRGHQQDREAKELGRVLREALEPAVMLDKFPKARLDIFVTVLEHDGGALSAALSCASLALAHAGVDMWDLVVGASLRRFNGWTLIDPTAAEEGRLETPDKSAVSAVPDDMNLTVGYMPSLRQISALVQGGVVDQSTNQQCLKICVEACARLLPILQKCLADHSQLKANVTDTPLAGQENNRT